MTLQEGATAQFNLKIGDDDMQTFARLSGDKNPIHWDAALARQQGYKGPLVYGGLLLAAVSRLLGMHLPGPGCIWHSVSLKFISPLYIDQPAEVRGTVTYANSELNLFRISVEIHSQDRLIARGEAQGAKP